jgi:hypothetical protein
MCIRVRILSDVMRLAGVSVCVGTCVKAPSDSEAIQRPVMRHRCAMCFLVCSPRAIVLSGYTMAALEVLMHPGMHRVHEQTSRRT